MTCAEQSGSVQAYVDRELAGVDRESVERHLVSCPVCARQVHLQARFKSAVRAHLPRPEVPLAFKLRIQDALGTQRIAPRRWPWLSYPRLVPAAAAFLLIVGITGTVRQSQSVVLEQAQRSYHAEMPMDITGSDCGSIASWFRGRVDFPVHAPVLGGGATCQGGRLVNVGERPAAYLLYRVQTGHRVALLVFDPRDQAIESPERRVVNGREIYVETGPGISTAAYRDRGLGYVMTADLDEEALTRLVTAGLGR
ncbi:MAG TPA: zf-HC2 domain-containing protein [Polyangia bacterium]|nr:zf-HC2 domain-containing protein [Polyangia bacterium]